MERVWYAIKSFLGLVVSTVAGIVRGIAKRLGGKNYIDPSKLIRRAQAGANACKVEWPDAVDYPNIFSLAVDVTSWENYYEGTLQVSSERIVKALSDYIHKKGGTLHGKIQVSIVPNLALELGDVTVDCSYSAASRYVSGVGGAVPMGETERTGMSITFDHTGRQVKVEPSKNMQKRVPTQEDGKAQAEQSVPTQGRQMTDEEFRRRRQARAQSVGVAQQGMHYGDTEDDPRKNLRRG